MDDRQRVKELVAAGKSRAEIATELGMHYQSVCRYIRVLGLSVRREGSVNGGRVTDLPRAQKMATMYQQGLTLNVIGRHFGLTRERVRQILRTIGIAPKAGGSALKAGIKREEQCAKAAAEYLLRWGASQDEMRKFRAMGVARAYSRQRDNARKRGIEFKLSISQWWSLWERSGRWEQRGRSKGQYVMSRIHDSGCYELGNVHIQLCSENCSEGIRKALANGRKRQAPGVWCIYPGSPKPWVAKYAKHYIGSFESEETASAARAAFLAANPAVVKVRGAGAQMQRAA